MPRNEFQFSFLDFKNAVYHTIFKKRSNGKRNDFKPSLLAISFLLIDF